MLRQQEIEAMNAEAKFYYEGAITSIVAYSELSRPVITLDTAKDVLKDVIVSD